MSDNINAVSQTRPYFRKTSISFKDNSNNNNPYSSFTSENDLYIKSENDKQSKNHKGLKIAGTIGVASLTGLGIAGYIKGKNQEGNVAQKIITGVKSIFKRENLKNLVDKT